MTRSVFDTNVIVSALVFGGVPRAALELAATGRCQFLYSSPILADPDRGSPRSGREVPLVTRQTAPNSARSLENGPTG